MIKLIHFADAHIDMANYGRHDPVSGLPFRVLDFLQALDQIIESAIQHKADLVIFAGDAYKDRSPAPTFQREWGRRIIQLSKAGIETILLVGNHDLSPATGRAHALQEYDTLDIPHIHVADRPIFYKPGDLNGVPVQVLAIPWITRSMMIARLGLSMDNTDALHQQMENLLREILDDWLEQLDPALPVILTAHGTVQGATYGGERNVMLGNDLILPRPMVSNPRLDYVALGHIHKFQNINPDAAPPVIYPGSIERVDFGEARDKKYFVIANVAQGNTTYEPQELKGRRFLDYSASFSTRQYPSLPDPETLNAKIFESLPPQAELKDAIVRLTLEYPQGWEILIDETALRTYAEPAFDFHLVRKPLLEARVRLKENESISSASPEKLLDLYWQTIEVKPEEQTHLKQLSQEIIAAASNLPIETQDSL